MMRGMERLDARLRTIASLVRKDARLADVGCDHGYLICALALDGVIPGGVACDVNEMPLEKARQLVARCGLEEKINCRISDGLEAVRADEADDIVIAGMGGELICAILERCRWEDRAGKRFLLQPMTRAPYLRRWLCGHGYRILLERACMAEGKYYTVIQAEYTGEVRDLSETDLYSYAGELSCDPSPEAKEYLRRTARSLQKREQGVRHTDPAEADLLNGLCNKLLTVVEGV